MNQFTFEIKINDSHSHARTGIISTPHGDIRTPSFVPVGTQATIKSLTNEDIKRLDTQLFFINTYHMAMRPGIETIEKAGGVHQFMNWQGPIITDSGGFQVFSLANRQFKPKELSHEPQLVKITDDGVMFRSHWDGAQHFFSPEESMQLQWKLGSDIHIAFDDCPPFPITYEKLEKSLQRTHAWAVRSLTAHKELAQKNSPYQALYGVIQGGVFQDLRIKSTNFITQHDFDGYAIGGVAVGEDKEEMKKVCDWVIPRLDQKKPRHLLGVGEVDDVFAIISRGVDTFDCVAPTRMARVGLILTTHRSDFSTKQFALDITKKKYAQDFSPLVNDCTCYTCTNHTKAYVHHLFRVHELLGYHLATLHNLHFMSELVKTISDHIEHNTFQSFAQSFLEP